MQVQNLSRAPFRPASIKVMQRTFNPLNRERYPGGPPIFASWCNRSMSGFDPVGPGANPGEAANSQPVSSKSERQSYKLRTLESYQHGLPNLPLSVEVCTPVSETGRAGALPAAAANLISMKNKHLAAHRGCVRENAAKLFTAVR